MVTTFVERCLRARRNRPATLGLSTRGTRDLSGARTVTAHAGDGPDTLHRSVVGRGMHLYLPADLSQINLGTALYRRKPGPLSKSDWQTSFTYCQAI